MAYELTSGRASAIAKLDFSGKSHCQRLDMVAKIFGAKNHASLMAGLSKTPASVQDEAGVTVRDLKLHTVVVLKLRDAKEEKPCFYVTIRKHFSELEGNVARSWHEDEIVGVVSPDQAEKLMRAEIGFRQQVGADIEFSRKRADHLLRAGPRDVFGTIFYLDGEQIFRTSVGPDDRLREVIGGDLLPRVENAIGDLLERVDLTREAMAPLREAHTHLSRPLSDDTDKGSEPGDPSGP